jgi:hypothetical protein
VPNRAEQEGKSQFHYGIFSTDIPLVVTKRLQLRETRETLSNGRKRKALAEARDSASQIEEQVSSKCARTNVNFALCEYFNLCSVLISQPLITFLF